MHTCTHTRDGVESEEELIHGARRVRRDRLARREVYDVCGGAGVACPHENHEVKPIVQRDEERNDPEQHQRGLGEAAVSLALPHEHADLHDERDDEDEENHQPVGAGVLRLRPSLGDLRDEYRRIGPSTDASTGR